MSVPIKGADESNPVVGIWRFPIPWISRTEDIIIIAEQLLTAHNILERDTVRISQHVVQHHEGRRPTPASFAMEMRPAILRHGPYGEDESIDLFIERTRMVRYCKAHIGGAIGLNNLTLHTRVLDSHILRRARSNAGFFDRRSWMNNDFAPGLERFHARGFVCLDLIVRATDVGPIVRGKPANRQTVDEYMRLLSQIENRDGTTRAPKQKLKPSVVNSPPPEAWRSAKPVLTGIFWPLFASSESSVVRKFRGRLLASFRSISEINTGESASAGRTGGFFCTSVAEKVAAVVRSKADSAYRTADGRDMSFLMRQLHAHALEEARNF